MALPTTAVWAVDELGSDTAYAGFFNPFRANAGLDRTYPHAPVAYSDLAIGGANNVLSSVARPFVATPATGDIGNGIMLASNWKAASHLGTGANYLTCADNAIVSIGAADDWTIHTAVAMLSSGINQTYIFAKRGEWDCYVTTSNQIVFRKAAVAQLTLSNTGVTTVGQWVFLTLTYNATTKLLKGYINGVLNNSATLATGFTDGAGAFDIMGQGAATAPAHRMGAFGIAKQELNSTEVAELANGGTGRHWANISAPTRAKFAEWWELQETTGNRVGTVAGTTLSMTGTVSYGEGFLDGFFPGRYEITAVDGSGNATVDRNAGVAGGTAGTAALGGCIKSINQLQALMTANQHAWLRGDISFTVATAFALTTTVNATQSMTRFRGYGTVRGDTGRAKIIENVAGGLSFGGTNNMIENIWFYGTYNPGVTVSCTNAIIRNCKFSNFGVSGLIITGTNIRIERCEFTGGYNGANARGAIHISNAGCIVENCYLHDNSMGNGSAIILIESVGAIIRNNVMARNVFLATATSYVIKISSVYSVVENNTIHDFRDAWGIYLNATVNTAIAIRNNLITGGQTAGKPAITALTNHVADELWDGNAFWNNAGGNRSNMDNVTTHKPLYARRWDVTLTGDPYVDKANSDFRLNDVAGAGAACKGPNRGWLDGDSAIYLEDIGALQSVGSKTIVVLD